jgi:SagB-type dehydrogenase family enzyme
MSVEQTFRYHERTKHRLDRYAAALGYLDWATQPDPFRRYAGAPLVALAEVPPTGEPTWDGAMARGPIAPRPLDERFVAQLLYDSLALSAWKEFQGARWSLRVNPSSGNLHPTEGYVLLPPANPHQRGPRAAVCHYAPHEHALEVRAEVPEDVWATFARDLPQPCLLVGLTSIVWREAWKYGERAFRYCQMDLGHALAAVTIAARCLGWHARLLDDVADGDLGALLGVHAQAGPEAELPEALLLVTPAPAPAARVAVDAAAWRALAWRGTPNTLSDDHHDWPVLAIIADGTRHAGTAGSPSTTAAPPPSFLDSLERGRSARAVVRQRRSAVDFDGRTGITRAGFLTMLARVASHERLPFAALPWPAAIHLALFVHRVADVEPGLYLLVRDAARAADLRAALRADFAWEPAAEELPGLVRLARGDLRHVARRVSCHQDIAADGAFALGMLGEFEPNRRARGASFYRRLHWEAGALGQVLYLEAEALGVRATGIGCFLDDELHEVLGLRDRAWQTIYHFTVGMPVEDARLRTAPAYAHRARG